MKMCYLGIWLMINDIYFLEIFPFFLGPKKNPPAIEGAPAQTGATVDTLSGTCTFGTFGRLRLAHFFDFFDAEEIDGNGGC